MHGWRALVVVGGLAAVVGSGCAEAPACDATLKVDGLVGGTQGCDEYLAPPMVGVYGVVHVAFAEDRMHLHNDWLLRDDADTPADAYNLFEFLDLGGTTRVEVRVFRDGAIETRVNGDLVDQGDLGAATFAPSARKATPHMQYEFSVQLPPGPNGKVLGWFFAEKDPGPGPITDPDDALVAEPTAMFIDPVNGSVESKEGPILIRAERSDDAIVVHGRNLGEGGKVLRNSNGAVTLLEWDAESIRLLAPGALAGERLRIRREDGLESNAITLQPGDVPPFDGKDCSDIKAGVPCEDGKACTSGDVCDGKGACIGKLDCASTGPCSIGACASDGSCEQVAAPAATPCGATTPCTAMLCDGTGLCAEQPRPNGTPCDDGKTCTTADTCNAGLCAGVQACPSENPCIFGSCDTSGGCAFANADEGQSCGDGDLCTSADHCSGGTCVGGPAVVCTPSGPCMAASCGAKTGCVETPLAAGSPCNDGDACTASDFCDGQGACKGDPVTNCD